LTGRTVIIGSRGSKLALWQSEHIKALLERLHPGTSLRIDIIKTTGDKIIDVPLAKIGDKGLFTKEIEQALTERRVDLAVHSLKDVPTKIEPGLILGAVTEREDVRDAWISKDGTAFENLPIGAIVATSSLRRRCQMRNRRPDLLIEDMRGNLDTRLRKMRESDKLAGIVLASAGLSRMGWADQITQRFDCNVMLPAVGQGALAIEVRGDDEIVRRLIQPLHHEPSALATRSERALLARLEGGCQIPIGAYGRMENGRLLLDAMVGSLDGARIIRDRAQSDPGDPEALGVMLAERLLAAGADKILRDILASGAR
jgi:hydroxymethylbilane synthase